VIGLLLIFGLDTHFRGIVDGECRVRPVDRPKMELMTYSDLLISHMKWHLQDEASTVSSEMVFHVNFLEATCYQ
jgi:hypothetical protein